MVALNVPLNVTQRIQLSNQIFSQNITYNDSYSLNGLQINLNPATPNSRKTETASVL
jgi:hypothetical protein